MSDDMTAEIPEVDRERIESMVQQYRHALENLYLMARIQGQIDQAHETSRLMQRRVVA